MSNECTKFPDNVPPDEDVYLWWDEADQTWHVWFGEELPMFADGEFTPLRTTFFRYKKQGAV